VDRHFKVTLRLCRSEGEVCSHMSKTYSDWLGRQVVLQVEAGESRVPLRGLVVSESNNALRFRLDGCWDVDIYKEMILRVEAADYEVFPLNNRGAVNKAPVASRSDSRSMLNWNRAMDCWWSKHFSWQMRWKTIIAAGLAGSILFVLALRMSSLGPGSHFLRFMCGYLGLVFFAVSLGCSARVFIYWIRTRSHVFARCSKLFASFLDWLRQPMRF
jgi:hypothetical protein